MSVAPGARLGPYEIIAKLGEGGMGEVWRATDTKLKREVAIKVLPEEFVEDRERLARFEREAQLLAQLHHPNIASIFGLEESGDVRALVMELVEGPTLAERLEKEPLPLDESLSFATQIAEALEEAHSKGIVHRDLKPQNIKASGEGKIKILDFGLAKAVDPAGWGAAVPSASELATAPTRTFDGTRDGVILGTVPYMSPEQARGLPVDKRTDIWAFGVVLYEMLTGRSLFAADSLPDTLAAVLTREIDWSRLPAATPASLRRLLRRCLERNPKNRLHDAADARLVLEDLLREVPVETGEEASARPASRPDRARRALPWAVALLASGTTAVVLWRGSSGPVAEERAVSEFGVLVPPPFALPPSQSPVVDLALDGRTLVFVAEGDRTAALFRRRMDHLASTPIEVPEGAQNPVISPDGRWIAFFADGKLRRVPAEGGAGVELADARAPRGVTWMPDGSLVFSPLFNSGLWRVAAAGGPPEKVTEIDAARGERTHRWPQALPDGRTILFTVGSLASPGDYDSATIDVLRLDSGERKTVLESARMARYTDAGYLLFQRRDTLFAVRFDLEGLAVRGEPFVVEEGVGGDAGSGAGYFSVSARGALAFAPEKAIPKERGLFLVDREGHETELATPPAEINRPRFSPDGMRLAFGIGDGAAASDDVYLFEIGSGRLQRLTFSHGRGAPVWSADGRRILYTLGRAGESGLAIRASDGSGEEERIGGEGLYFADSWLADGRVILTDYAGTLDIRLLDPGRGSFVPLAARPDLAEYGAVSSPGGRFVAYTSTETGTDEVFVESLPAGAGKFQISTSGGACPVWSRDGREIFYATGSTLMAVDVEEGGAFRSGAPHALFSGPYELCDPPRRHYDVGPDGRFVAIRRRPASGEPRELVVLDGWATSDSARSASR